MPLLLLLFVVVTVGGHIGKVIVERKCAVTYFRPTAIVPRVTYFVAIHPVEGLSDSIQGLASGWEDTCKQVRFRHDLARRTIGQ